MPPLSPRSTPRAPSTRLHRVLTRRGRSRETTMTGLDSRLPASSGRHLHHVRCPGRRLHDSTLASIRRGRSRETTMTGGTRLTASCELRTAPSPRSTSRAPSTRIPWSINPAGAITGLYFDAGNIESRLPASSGRLLHHVRLPGSISTDPQSINPAGAITGCYCTTGLELRLPASSGRHLHHVRYPGRRPTAPYSINPAGAITGVYDDGTRNHGFLRAPDGTFTTFDIPGAVRIRPPLASIRRGRSRESTL